MIVACVHVYVKEAQERLVIPLGHVKFRSQNGSHRSPIYQFGK